MMMNLTTDPWIPVVWEGGRPGLVSLTEAFQRGEEIQDLAVRPHERIAIMRLLICIAQAALDGPKDHLDWQTCRERIVPAAAKYLKKWCVAFELFGDDQRFMQVENLKENGKSGDDDDGGNSISKLNLTLATGNNTTLFDNGGGSDRTFTPAQLALMLLTFQCFSPGGRIGVVSWKGKPTPGNGSSDHAPCLPRSMVHSLIRGTRLIETIHRNLLSKETVSLLVNKDGWGRPSWEQMPASAQDAPAVQNTTATYLGRFLPLARAIRLENDGLSAVLGNGLKYPPYEEWREPTATIVVRQRSGKPERVVLGASLDRAPWRELHSLAVRRVSRDTNGGPVALQNIADSESFDLWVGGMVADKAKLLDAVEAVFHVPAGMLTEPVQRIYEDGVQYAGDLDFLLRRAVSSYHKELGNNLDRPEMREQRQRIQSKATFQFWTAIERDVQRLLDVVGNAETWPAKDGWSQTVWGKAVWTAAMRAFDSACPHDTARQMRAFALARQVLFRAKQPDNSTDKPEETES